MNIAIVGFDYDFTRELAQKISEKLSISFVDFKEHFEKFLLSNNSSIFQENEILNNFETKMFKQICVEDNVVVSFPDDVVLSNKNYKYLKNNLILFINSQNNNKIQLNLKKLIKNINIEINKENYNFEDIIKKIRGFYDR